VLCCAVPGQVTVMPPGQLPPEHSSHLVLPALGPGKVFSKSFDGWGLQVRGFCSHLLTCVFLNRFVPMLVLLYCHNVFC